MPSEMALAEEPSNGRRVSLNGRRVCGNFLGSRGQTVLYRKGSAVATRIFGRIIIISSSCEPEHTFRSKKNTWKSIKLEANYNN